MSITASTVQTAALTRWTQVALGAICMLVPGTLLYGWTVFVNPIHDAQGWTITQVQFSFTFFVLSEACLMWAVGPFVDRWGPKPTMFAAGVLIALGAYINSRAGSLGLLYLGQTVSGIGSGIVTCATIRSVVAWFPHKHRGLATGIVVTGFALGALITILPMVGYIKAHGYQAAFLWFGGVMGVGLMIVALVMRFPVQGEVPVDVDLRQEYLHRRHYRPSEMVRTRAFWALGLVFLFICMSGHLVTAHLGPIMNHFNTRNVDVQVLFGAITMTGFTLALFIDRCANVAGRPFFGFLSDVVGREKALALALVVEVVGIYLLLQFANDPFWFAVLSGAVFFAFGEIYVLVPALIADIYGEQHAATNYGWIYIAKGLASLFVPLGSWIVATTGSWNLVFYSAMVVDALGIVLALSIIPLKTRLDSDIEATRRIFNS